MGIRVDRGPRPRGAIEGLGRERQERGLFERLEHDARDLARGAVHARAGQVAGPHDRPRPHLGQVPEGLPAEEILPAVGNAALHFGFPRGVADHGGVDDEAAVLRVLEEHAVDPGGVAIGPGDDGLQVILDEPLDHAAETLPGGLEPVEDGGEVLAQADPEKRVAAEAEGHQQAVHAAPVPGGGIEPPSEQAEVHLGGFPRRGLGHADGHRGVAEVALGAGKPIECAVGDADLQGPQAPRDLGEAQLVVGQPRADLLAVRRQRLHLRTRGRRRVPREVVPHGGELRVRGQRAAPRQAHGHRRPHVPGDGLAVEARRTAIARNPSPARQRRTTSRSSIIPSSR